MRFTTETSKPGETPVLATLRAQSDGHIALLANGIEVLWLTPDGKIMRNTCDSDALRDLGFQVLPCGRVALTTVES